MHNEHANTIIMMTRYNCRKKINDLTLSLEEICLCVYGILYSIVSSDNLFQS